MFLDIQVHHRAADASRKIAGSIILATIFIHGFSVSIFLYSPGSEPLERLLYYFSLQAAYGRMAAVGLMIWLACTVLIAIALKISCYGTK